MTTTQTTIKVPSRLARAYQSASTAEREKATCLMEFLLNNKIREDESSLTKLMQKASKKAQKKGMTPATLEKILGKKIRHIL